MLEPLPPGSTCVDAVERSARIAPDVTAIIDGEHTWTYADLLAEVRARSQALLAAGLTPGDRVALVAESSASYLATALAVWKAGAVLVTVYPASSREDLDYALTQSDPVLVIVGEEFDRALLDPPPGPAPIMRLNDPVIPPVAAGRFPNPGGLREPLHLICFSSGTTSTPKAIMLSATAVLNCAQTYAEVWHLNGDDRGIVCLPMAWMYGLASTSLAILYGGGTVVVVRRARPDLITQAVHQHRATFLAGVANTFAKLVRHLEELGEDRPTLRSLRLCVSGGEPPLEAAFDRWTELTGRPVFDAYCASECLPLVTYDPYADAAPRHGSAGRVVPRSRLRVVDTDGNDVPAGQTGEGLSTGPGLMLGYWRDPEQTRAALTPDGWYRTKDIVRIDDDGYVYVIGRLSDLIIRAGVNISPAEVERVLRRHADVADVAVVGLPDEMYGQRVVAAIVAVPGTQPTEESLRGFAKANLTAFRVPSEFHLIDDLPLNATGKVSRKDLAQQLIRDLQHTEGRE